MNGLGAQDVAAFTIVLAAGGWLAWRRVRASRSGKGADCENCASAAPLPPGVRPAPQPELLLAIGEPAPPKEGGTKAR